MKRIIIMCLILVLSILAAKAEPIHNKDFEKYFISFQKEVKVSKGIALSVDIFINFETMEVKNQDCDEQMKLALDFLPAFEDDWKSVIKLNKKNKYTFGKALPNKTRTNKYNYWEVQKADRQYSLSDFGVMEAYILFHNVQDENGNKHSNYCVFAELNTYIGTTMWGIVGFGSIND